MVAGGLQIHAFAKGLKHPLLGRLKMTFVRADTVDQPELLAASLPLAREQEGLWQQVMGLGTILIIILVLALLGGFSGLGGGPFYGTGYYGGGGLGLLLLIIIILVILGRI